MDYGTMLSDSIRYAGEAVWGRWKRWFLLLVSTIIFPFILGYAVRIYCGEKPAPELGNWGTLFIDGLKLFVIQVIYAIPVLLLLVIALLPFFSVLAAAGLMSPDAGTMTEAQAQALMTDHPEILSALGSMMLLLLFAILIAIIIGIFSFIGIIRFARTGHVGEAFNFSAILSTIRKIGWVNYLIALFIIGVIGMAYGILMNAVPVLGMILGIVFYPAFIIFASRYASILYDAGEAGPIPGTA